MKKSTPNYILSAGIGLILASAAFAAPDPSKVFIKRITYSGSGCQSSTVTGTISNDAESFTLIFSDYITEVGPDSNQGHDSRKCKVTVDLRFPSGYSYAVSEFTYRGYAYLEPGVTAQQNSAYYFQNAPGNRATFQSNFYGYYDDNFSFTDSIGFDDFVWSRCGKVKPLVVETDLELDNSSAPQASGMIGIDSLDGAVNTYYRYKIYWNDEICD